jgi:GGDEF domain-containing protein
VARLDHAGFDPGTGLLEPTWLDLELPAVLARARESGATRIALLLLVDRLTAPGGDLNGGVTRSALQVYARLVLLSVRDTDMCVRCDDSSVLVVLDASPELAARVATRVRKVVNSHDWGRISPHLRLHTRALVAAPLPAETAPAWLARLRQLATVPPA